MSSNVCKKYRFLYLELSTYLNELPVYFDVSLTMDERNAKSGAGNLSVSDAAL